MAMGSGALATGTAAVLAAAWFVPHGLGAALRGFHRWPGGHHWLGDHSLRVLAVALVVVAILWAVTAFRRRRSSFASNGSRFLGPGVVLAVAAVTAAWAAAAVRLELDTGFLGPETVVAGAGAVAVLAGSLVVVIAGRRAGTVPFSGALLAAIAAAVVVVVAATACAVTAPGHGLIATVAAPAGTPAVPATVSRVAWSRAMPAQVLDVVPAGPGVLVLLDDGVVAVDGRTGRTRWTYRRPGAYAHHLSVSPDGRSALLHWGSGGSQLVALDAGTGRVRYTREDVDWPHHIPMTNDVWLSEHRYDRDHLEYDAWSLRDGHHRWRFRVPGDCWLDHPENVVETATADAVIFPVVCSGARGDSVRFVAYGANSTPLWQRNASIPGTDPEVLGVSADPAADGSSYGARIEVAHRDLTMGLDPRTGRSRPYHQYPVSSTRWVERGDRGDVVHDADGRAWPIPPAPCTSAKPMLGDPETARGGTAYWVDSGWTFAAGAVGCTTTTGAFTARGTQVVQVHDFSSGRRRQIRVDLGGPYLPSGLRDTAMSSVVAAPGAWVVAPRDYLAPGGVNRVVGLR
ncbi:MAG TPA: hypothetical protein VGN37_26620 [Actinocatenispora sp.]